MFDALKMQKLQDGTADHARLTTLPSVFPNNGAFLIQSASLIFAGLSLIGCSSANQTSLPGRWEGGSNGSPSSIWFRSGGGEIHLVVAEDRSKVTREQLLVWV